MIKADLQAHRKLIFEVSILVLSIFKLQHNTKIKEPIGRANNSPLRLELTNTHPHYQKERLSNKVNAIT